MASWDYPAFGYRASRIVNTLPDSAGIW